ncbi:hypothetical protein RGO69_002277 [Morganella morganii]|nr:hypothetical protein [Morganella morganii]
MKTHDSFRSHTPPPLLRLCPASHHAGVLKAVYLVGWRGGAAIVRRSSATVFHDRHRFLKADYSGATDMQLRYRYVSRIQILVYDEPHSEHYSASDSL